MAGFRLLRRARADLLDVGAFTAEFESGPHLRK
jgi:hypothetical protein